MKELNGTEYSDLEYMITFQKGIHILARKRMKKIYQEQGKKEMLEAYNDAVKRNMISDDIKEELHKLIDTEDHSWN